MLDKFYYENHLGERLTFGEDGIYANYSDLRSYNWEVETKNRKIADIYRNVSSKSIPCVFVGDSLAEVRKLRNAAFELFEQDVVANKPGKFHVGDYTYECYVVGCENSEYLEDKYMVTNLTIKSDDPVWRTESRQEFFANSIESDDVDGLGYPYDYPYDYSAQTGGQTKFESPFVFPAAFLMHIYGPTATAPSITIGGHKYALTETLSSGQYVTIDSVNKTITMKSGTASVNWFGKRYKAESIFEKVPAGVSTMVWSGLFSWDITLYGERSEPPWEYTEEETDKNAYVTSDGYEYATSDSGVYEVS